MLPSATELHYFLEVVKTQNISHAAKRLGISQPTLTQSMKKLEDVVGSSLLIRGKNGVRLTRAGERVAGKAASLLELWQAVRKTALEEEMELKGQFKVGCHASVGRYVLPAFFSGLAKRMPQVEISLSHDLSRRVAEAVINLRVDLGFVINPPEHPDLVLKKLGTDVVAIFQSSQKQYSNVLFGDSDLTQTQAIMRQLKKASFSYSSFVHCSNLEVIDILVRSGAGYGILPSRVAHCSPAPHPVIADPKLPVFHDEIYLVYRKDMMATRAGKVLLEMGSQVLANEQK